MLAFSEHGPGFDCRNYCVVHAEAGRNAGMFLLLSWIYCWNSGVLHTDNREECCPFLKKDCGIVFLLPNARQ